MPTTTSRSRAGRAALAAACLLAFAGCGSPPAEPPAQEEAFALLPPEVAADVSGQVRQILADSQGAVEMLTVALEDGSTTRQIVRRPLELDLPRGTWSPPSGATLPTPGAVVATFALEQWPRDIAIADDGTVVAALADRVAAWGPGEGGAGSTVAPGQASTLQWSHDGARLLVSGPQVNALHAWPGLARERDLSALRTEGYLQFAPDTDHLWQVSEQTNFDASQPVRVRVLLSEIRLDGGEPRDLAPGTNSLARVGTLPPLGVAWAHVRELYQIDPTPAPLWVLDETRTLEQQLTGGAGTVDLDPVADRQGRVWFIQGRRRGGRSSRAHVVDVTAPRTERAVTAEPTYDVAVSPDGTHAAVLVLREGSASLVRTTTDELLARDLSAATDASARLADALRAAQADLLEAFLATPQGATRTLEDHGWTITVPPDEVLVDAMDAALRDAVADHFGFTLSGDFRALGELDALIAESDGIWTEDPATVTALAAAYGNALARHGDVIWHLEPALPQLGFSVQELSQTDDLHYTLHAAFYAAREALAGRVHLDAVGRELLANWEQPVALVESFDAHARNLMVDRLSARAGLDFTRIPDAGVSRALTDALLAHRENDMVASLALIQAERLDDWVLGVVAGLNLARNNPASPRALYSLGFTLQRVGLVDEAFRVYARAEELAPDDAGLAFDIASAHFDELRLDEAERRFLRARRLDTTNFLSEVIELNLGLIEEQRLLGRLEAIESPGGPTP